MNFLNLVKIKSQVIVFLVMAFSLMSVSHVAEAKRLGFGKSIGYQKQVAPKQYNTAPKKTAPQSTKPSSATQTKPATGASKWLGPLAGLAAGGLIAAMLFGDGFDGIQLFDILLFALIAFVLFKIFAGRVARQQSAYQPVRNDDSYREAHVENESVYQRQNAAASSANQGSIIGADLDDGIGQGVSDSAHFFNEIPSWFNEQQFVEGAKQHFITLQKAWDNVDLSEIESYCTPDLFAALQKELSGVQPGDNQTRVDELNAEVAAMAVDGEYLVVSICFSGFIEEDTQGAHAFNEIWHIRRLASDEGNWQVAGIQQSSEVV